VPADSFFGGSFGFAAVAVPPSALGASDLTGLASVLAASLGGEATPTFAGSSGFLGASAGFEASAGLALVAGGLADSAGFFGASAGFGAAAGGASGALLCQ